MARSGEERSPLALPSSSRASGRPLLCRRRKSSATAARRLAGDNGARISGPSTPFVRWKLGDGGSKLERRKISPEIGVSARKLAAGIWQLQVPESSAPANCISSPTRRGHGHRCRDSNLKKIRDSSNVASSKHSRAMADPAMERATKWDPGDSTASDIALRFYNQLKHMEDRHQTTSNSFQLQAELEDARSQIQNLESERRDLKNKLNQFFNKMEKSSAAVADLKESLHREKKTRRRIEIANSKLMESLADAEISSSRHYQELEKERKARELVEEICDELAKEIGEDKSELESLRRELAAVREEVEEERKMLQMAEVWREERVQMKLIDAKLVLEEKYTELSKLKSELEEVLSCGGGGEAAEKLKAAADAAAAAAVTEIKEFRYQAAEEGDEEDSEWETTSESGSGVTEEKLQELGSWSSPEMGKTKCMEWRKGGGGEKESLKAKLLEARIESQKIQLRHVLRQKI